MKEYTDNDGRLYREVQLKDGTIAKIKVPMQRELSVLGLKYKTDLENLSDYVKCEFILFDGEKRTLKEVQGLPMGDSIKLKAALN